MGELTGRQPGLFFAEQFQHAGGSNKALRLFVSSQPGGGKDWYCCSGNGWEPVSFLWEPDSEKHRAAASGNEGLAGDGVAVLQAELGGPAW